MNIKQAGSYRHGDNMITAAAIWYVCEQNEPSVPFLLDLACPDEPTVDDIKNALASFFLKTSQEMLDDEYQCCPEDKPVVNSDNIVVDAVTIYGTSYGDLCVYAKSNPDTIVFVTLRPELVKLLPEPERRTM